MTGRLLPRLLAAAATLTALAAAVTAFAGSGFAEGSAAQANYAPRNTTVPTIQGAAQVGQTLTATSGSWSTQTTPTYSYQWELCDAGGTDTLTPPPPNLESPIVSVVFAACAAVPAFVGTRTRWTYPSEPTHTSTGPNVAPDACTAAAVAEGSCDTSIVPR